MQNALRFVPLFAVAALIVTGNLSASHAANCEASLKPTYACTASLSSGQSVDYCLRPDVDVPGEGRFGLHEDSGVGYYCTCEAKGKTPSVQFGVSSRDSSAPTSTVSPWPGGSPRPESRVRGTA